MPRLSALLLVLLTAGLAAPAPAQAVGLRKAKRAALLDPMDASAWAMLGDAYKRRGRKRAAMSAYERALSIAPDDAEIRGKLEAVGLPRLSKLERKALRNPQDDELWGDLADQYVAYGRTDTAVQYYLYALRLDPSDSEWRDKITQHGAPDQVAEAMGGIVATSADDEAIGDYGDSLWDAGNTEEACVQWGRALELDPDDSEWPDKLRDRCGGGGFGGFSEPSYPEEAPADAYGSYGGGTISGVIGGVVASNDAQVLLNQARAKLLEGDRAGALDAYERALLLDPTDSNAVHAVMVLSGVTKVDLLERLTERVTDNDELWGDLADHYLAIGRLEEATAAYEQALALDPDDDEWSRKLVVIRPADPDASAPPAELVEEVEGLGFGVREP